jgi:pimeloyl-ACP methyl ester carboxylesterase
MKKLLVYLLFSTVFPTYGADIAEPLRQGAAVKEAAPIWKVISKGCFVQVSATHTAYIIQERGDGEFPIEAVLVIPNAWKSDTNCVAWIESSPRTNFDLDQIKANTSQFARPIVHLFPRGSRLLDNNYPTEIIDRNPANAATIELEAAPDYGEKHIDDLGVLLQRTNEIIKGKFIIYGGSLGGYMAVQALMDPGIKELFAAGISVSGFYSLDTTRFFKDPLPEIALATQPVQLSDIEKADMLTPRSYVETSISNYKDLSKEELTRRAFPIDCPDQIKVPLLVIHGGNDYTTLCSLEGARTFAEVALKTLGNQFTYVEIPGATHMDIYAHELFMKSIGVFLHKHKL